MTTAEALQLLDRYRAGFITREDVLHAFQKAPVADLGFAQVDLHRSLRKNFPEVIYGEGKTPAQIIAITEKLMKADGRVLVTRIQKAEAKLVRKKFPAATYHEKAACLTLAQAPLAKRPGTIAIVAAGTTDLPVAEEAAVTADFMGNTVSRIYDVGVAGLHRLLRRVEDLQRANVVVAIAGMEGALPSVIGGLIAKPIIAVPTSVGYGSHFGGIAPLLAMLNSCSSGMTVVNINNGFGAAYAASQINALAAGELG